MDSLCLLPTLFLVQSAALLTGVSLLEHKLRSLSQSPARLAGFVDVIVGLFSASLRLAVAMVICIFVDLLVLATLHLAAFYVYTVR